MKSIKLAVEKFLADEDGASAVEYAILVGLIVLAVATAVSTLGDNSSARISKAAECVADKNKCTP